MSKTESKTSPALLNSERPALRRLFEGLEIYPNLAGEDMREMAKFTEETNILGLPVHPIAQPVRDLPAAEFPGALADLPVEHAGGAIRAFRTLFSSEASILVRGNLAGATERPFRLSVIMPQSSAHLAHGLERMLWPITQETESARETWTSDFALILWPDYDDQVVLHLPAEGIGLVLGTDDLRAGLIMVVEAAHRIWGERRAQHEAAPKVEGEKWEDIQILPGGCFPLIGSDDAELVFAGDSIPDEWEKWLVQKIPTLAVREPIECLLAGAEPWIAEGGGWISPFWRNAPLPAQMLAQSPDWTHAAEHPDALPFGVHINAQGEMKLNESNDDAFVIVPREAVALPHINTLERFRIAKIWTHKSVKSDATKLWAIGFPKAEII